MNERRDVESTIISSLLKNLNLSKSCVLNLICSITTTLEDLWNTYLKSARWIIKKYFRNFKEQKLLDFDTIQKLYNSDFIGYGIFERYQQNLLEAYQISQANEVINEFNQSPNMQSFEVMLTDLNQVSLISATDETSTKQIVDEFVEELYSDEPKDH